MVEPSRSCALEGFFLIMHGLQDVCRSRSRSHATMIPKILRVSYRHSPSISYYAYICISRRRLETSLML